MDLFSAPNYCAQAVAILPSFPLSLNVQLLCKTIGLPKGVEIDPNRIHCCSKVLLHTHSIYIDGLLSFVPVVQPAVLFSICNVQLH
jgi:hypothetical protein